MRTDEWVASLKPGDEVVIRSTSYGDAARQLRRVDRVTPSGRVVVSGRTFNPDGFERGSTGWRRPYIEPATPENREWVCRATVFSRLNWMVTHQPEVSTETLREIAKVLGVELPPGEGRVGE